MRKPEEVSEAYGFFVIYLLSTFIPRERRAYANLSDIQIDECVRKDKLKYTVIYISIGLILFFVSFLFPWGPICGSVVLIGFIVYSTRIPNKYSEEIKTRKKLDPLYNEYIACCKYYLSIVPCPKCNVELDFGVVTAPFLGKCWHCDSVMDVKISKVYEKYSWTGMRGGMHFDKIEYNGLIAKLRKKVRPGEKEVLGRMVGGLSPQIHG
jgi:hypothetical protein